MIPYIRHASQPSNPRRSTADRTYSSHAVLVFLSVFQYISLRLSSSGATSIMVSIIFGADSGSAATGSNQVFKQFIKSGVHLRSIQLLNPKPNLLTAKQRTSRNYRTKNTEQRIKSLLGVLFCISDYNSCKE